MNVMVDQNQTLGQELYIVTKGWYGTEIWGKYEKMHEKIFLKLTGKLEYSSITL